MLQEPNNTNSPEIPKLIRWEEIRGIPTRLSQFWKADDKRISDLETSVVALTASIAVLDAFKDRFFIGAVNGSDGSTDSPFPTGWSSSRTSTGVYVVTHDFGDSDGYIVAPGLDDSSEGLSIVYERDSDSFDIEITDDAGNYEDANFTFIVVKI